MIASIGFMQGRLSPLVDGKIQAFPWQHWRDEFPAAQSLGLTMMEWTIDQDRLHENPLMTASGRREIRALGDRHGLSIPSLTGDCFMQAPFYKKEGRERAALLGDLRALIEACADVGVRFIVVPLVDAGRLDDARQKDALCEGLFGVEAMLKACGVKIIFESDYQPAELKQFIDGFPAETFGINFDIGNSASLGIDPKVEIPTIAARIDNVHVKDRKLGGTTVPLGQGNADLPMAFRLLREIGYRGNYILQTARAADGDHAGALARYRDMVLGWLAAGD